MAGPPPLHASLASYQSLRPNLYQTTSSSRVSSDQMPNNDEKASTGHKHKSHRHHHHHSSRHDREHRHSSSRRHAKEVVQSAIQLQPPTSFGDLLKQARGSKDTTPSHSRKGSVAQGADGSLDERQNRDVGITIPPRRPIRAEDVELERKRVEARERNLRNALKSLSDQSLRTSRRLDDTYYSVLEKVSVLRQTIGSLQELSSLTKELHENFESDTKELVDDVQGQYESFEDFESQQQQIVVLEQRIKAGKEMAESLTDRLARAKERVDARAQTESEWQAKNNRRMRMFWSTLGFITAVIIALILFHHFKPIHASHDPKATLDFASRAQIMEAPIPDIAKEAIIGVSASNTEPKPVLTNVVSSPVEDDKRLRTFDEL
ncbi:hypothetical protein EK21DRAFT_96343 [Setomelanomma holmii]|uniref:Uncharacterized protein n=1 Tax=Setomelanomma holmii TaxID=210430 RepID=A0A9P4HI70_9PLEO|nr:hypothetical protein EK21DRAFT_96343 [Setomelanomma holmii]